MLKRLPRATLLLIVSWALVLGVLKVLDDDGTGEADIQGYIDDLRLAPIPGDADPGETIRIKVGGEPPEKLLLAPEVTLERPRRDVVIELPGTPTQPTQLRRGLRVTIPPETPGGSYTLQATLVDESGEVRGRPTAKFFVTG